MWLLYVLHACEVFSLIVMAFTVGYGRVTIRIVAQSTDARIRDLQRQINDGAIAEVTSALARTRRVGMSRDREMFRGEPLGTKPTEQAPVAEK